MKTWRDHISPDEHYTPLAEYDDGSAVCLSSYAGGRSDVGLWGGITLMQINASGETTFREYSALDNWHSPVVAKGEGVRNAT